MAPSRLLRLVVIVVCAWAVAPGAWANPQLLVDLRTEQVLYAEDAGLAWHPASLTKLMTAYVAFSAIAERRVTLDTPVILSRAAVRVQPAKSGLPAEYAVSMRDALFILLVKSANDMAIAVAETVSGSEARFVAEMNATAQRLGLTATRYANPHGLHNASQVSSARDLALLAVRIHKDFPQYLPIFRTRAVLLGEDALESNNGLLTGFAGTTGMKTGFICASGLNIVATVERSGKQLLAVVLGGSSARERDQMAAELMVRGLARGQQPALGALAAWPNIPGNAPDLRPQICGEQAVAYVQSREAAYPFGLDGQPSYLSDTVEPVTYRVTVLGRLRNVPLPVARPQHGPRQLVAALPQAPSAPGTAALPPLAGPVPIPLARPTPSAIPLPVPRPGL